jgi:hypothetical protein
MSLTKVLLTCALLMTGQAGGGPIHTNLRSGSIPSKISPDRRADIREMQLYMSADQGKSWAPIDRITPDKGAFTYALQADGEFWFKVLIINQQGKSEPPDAFQGAVAMKLIVDTKPPELKIVSAQRQNDDLVVEWQANDQNPDPLTLKIEYRPIDSQTWTAMPLTPNAMGTARAKVATASPLVVRLSLWDLAKNFKAVEAQVPGGVASIGYNAAPPLEKAATTGVTQPPLDPPTSALPPLPPAATVPQLPPGHTGLSEQTSGVATPANPVQGGIPKMAVIATTNSGGPSAATQPTTNLQPAHPRTMPDLQLVNDPEIVLEYKVSNIGPSGLKSIEVWITRDGGATWTSYAEEETPALIANGGTYQRTLKLPEDGVYGISLVVKSKAGLGRPAPRAGDVPEMLVELDTVPPEGTLLPPVPDPKTRNTLNLSWTAKDRNLSDTPITLEWAETPTGPWQMIAANWRNSGRYPWTLPQSMPSHVYLKMTIRDAAGNVGVAVTDRPQLVDVSEPEGRLIRVTPLNKKQ